MRIAVVGAGISGLVAAYLLQREHEVSVFDAAAHLGGHTHTHRLERPDGSVQHVDTGFIVYNDRTYPNFIRLLDELGVANQPTAMSFGVRCERSGLEYCGTNLDTLFAQRRNLFRPRFLGMIRQILRFNEEAKSLLDADGPGPSLGDYLAAGRYGEAFTSEYLIPMGAAIWSAPMSKMMAFPARAFVRFFDHHGLLSIKNRPQWRVIRGGSARYLEPLTAGFADRIQLECKIVGIQRYADRVSLTLEQNQTRDFDAVVLACHSDQALAALAAPTPTEQEVLGAIAYQRNQVLLHTDESLLPVNPKARACWNYFLPRDDRGVPTVTYDMNRLQGLTAAETFCVSLNQQNVRTEAVIKELEYQHPVYTAQTFSAQDRHSEISGHNRTHYCGAYWRYGFHEDGVLSGIRVAEQLGVRW